jgi:ABC-type transport system substrate-binding protein
MKKILILCSFLILASCFKQDSKSTRNILKVPLSGEIRSLDPANAYDSISSTVIYQCYEQLYEYHYLKRPYTVTPLLAKELPMVSNDSLTYTIKLKENILYHPHPVFKGQKRYVKAQDFITQIKRLAYIPTNSNGSWLFSGKIVGIDEWRKKVGSDFEKFKSTKIPGLSAPNDHTLVFKFNKPYPQVLYALTMSFVSPMPIEVIEYHDNILNNVEIGTGPFTLNSNSNLANIKLDKFKDYRDSRYPAQGDRLAYSKGLLKDAGKQIPFLDGIHFKIIKEAQTRWLNFMSQKIDYLDIPKDNYETAVGPTGEITPELKSKNIHLQIYPSLTYWWISFNMRDPLLGKNKKLRLAIAHAIDYDKFIEIFTNNIGQRANSIFPPGIPGYSPSSKLPYEFNIEKAKRLLASAGFPEGKGLPVLNFDTRGTSTSHRQQAEFNQKQLEQIGIRMNIITNPFPTFLSKAENGKLQFWQDGWILDYPDVENVLQLLDSKNHSPGPNATFYSNPEFDRVFSELKELPDGPAKFRNMKKLEQMVIEDMPWVMQYYTRKYVLYHDHLKNFRPSDLIYNSFKYLKIK